MTLAFAVPTLDAVEKFAVFLVMISVLVVLHEGGHFLLARRNGVRVNDFAVGFGPTLLKWTSKRSGTNYRLNLLPIGGYCAMQGEDGITTEAEQQRDFRASGDAKVARGDSFQAKTPWQRLSIVVAGPVANFVLAYVILVIAAVSFGVVSPTSKATNLIGPVTTGSPGAKVGLQAGDRIVAIDGTAFGPLDGDNVLKKIQASPNRPLRLTYERGGARTSVTVTPISVKEKTKSIGRIGFGRVFDFQRMGFTEAVTTSGLTLVEMVKSQAQGIASLVSNPVAHASQVSGVIGMEQAAATYQAIGWGPYLQLGAMISLALGMFNLLPVPALDGGRGVFIVAELLRGRPVDAEKEAVVHVAGFAVLMALIALVAYHDIANIVSGKGVF